ncbi:MAG: 50S ribosomal protein L4 [Oscillospiraceae bacterium]|nr:50S ribosomal protein L4 [Oscillospiraceae bacterium]
MSMAKVYDMAGKQLGEVELSEVIFGIEPNMPAVHAVVKNHLANCRQGTQSALTRAEVSGGGKKPWRQKGTGRARQGSTRSPQWTHGGIVFAPKPRSYRYTLNKKLKRLALKSVLSDKAQNGNIAVVEDLVVAEPKTKTMVNLLNAIEAGKSVVITNGVQQNVVLSARNIPGVVTTPANILSVYDLVNAKTLVIDKAALATIEEVYA